MATLPDATADEATAMASYARLVARLAHRFADRAGVLDAAGLDEGAFLGLEASVLHRLGGAIASGDRDRLASFARTLIEARRGLRGDVEDAAEPATQAAPTRAATTMADPPSGSPTEVDPPSDSREHAGGPPAVDLSDLMATLHSTTGGRPPSSR